MPALYSTDLRQRVIDAYQAKEGSLRQLADRFKVSKSFVQRLIGHYRNTGQVTPLPHAGGAFVVMDNLPVHQAQVIQDKNCIYRC